MTVTAAEILTAETVPQYLKDRWDSEGLGKAVGGGNSAEEALEGVEVNAIMGGNVNYAFCIRLPGLDNKAIFLKQAPEFVAIFGPDGFPLTSERMQREMDVYSEYKGLLGEELDKKYLPEIFFFDSKW
jgi:5-methylthioribose kinase